MCLLIFKPASFELSDEYLDNGAYNNPHGAGVAIADGQKLIIQKSVTWGAEEVHKILQKFKGHPAIVHFRYATHGGINNQNTHPFWLNDKWAAAHNGVIYIPTHKDESDTRAFLRIHVKPFLKDNIPLSDKDVLALLGEEMGSYNKMVYLSAEGDVGIVNENSGHWNKGIWFSNHDYEDVSCYLPSEMSQMGYGNITLENERLPYSDSVLYYPTETEGLPEIWHRFDASRLLCDVCDKRIEGSFKIGAETGLVVCEMCEFFGAEEKLMNNN